jgi:ABC-type Mn2+/Zn2+ transport system permease subunit
MTVWVGLALAYFYNYPAGFYITTVAFALYVAVRAARALIDHPPGVLHRERRAEARA